MADCKTKLLPEEASSFREALRASREACLRDAEAFDEVLFVIERLGSRLLGKVIALGSYSKCLAQLAQHSILVATSPEGAMEGRPYFPALLRTVQEARNDALHQGAVARHLTVRVCELALVLEDALGWHIRQVEYMMIRHPVVAHGWHTVAAVRQLMLANAFSYLPYSWNGEWKLISDYEVAKFLENSAERKSDLAIQLELAIRTGRLQLIAAERVLSTAGIHEAIEKMTSAAPVLVTDAGGERLLGLIAPADVL